MKRNTLTTSIVSANEENHTVFVQLNQSKPIKGCSVFAPLSEAEHIAREIERVFYNSLKRKGL